MVKLHFDTIYYVTLWHNILCNGRWSVQEICHYDWKVSFCISFLCVSYKYGRKIMRGTKIKEKITRSNNLVSLYRIHECLVYTKKYNQLLKKIWDYFPSKELLDLALYLLYALLGAQLSSNLMILQAIKTSFKLKLFSSQCNLLCNTFTKTWTGPKVMKRECIPCFGSHHQKSCFKSKRKLVATFCALAYKFENADNFYVLDLWSLIFQWSGLQNVEFWKNH